jgi:hypothetical protein
MIYKVEIFQYGTLQRLCSTMVDGPDSLAALTIALNDVRRELGYFIFNHAFVTLRPTSTREFEMFVFTMDERGAQHPRRLGIVTLCRAAILELAGAS